MCWLATGQRTTIEEDDVYGRDAARDIKIALGLAPTDSSQKFGYSAD